MSMDRKINWRERPWSELKFAFKIKCVFESCSLCKARNFLCYVFVRETDFSWCPNCLMMWTLLMVGSVCKTSCVWHFPAVGLPLPQVQECRVLQNNLFGVNVNTGDLNTWEKQSSSASTVIPYPCLPTALLILHHVPSRVGGLALAFHSHPHHWMPSAPLPGEVVGQVLAVMSCPAILGSPQPSLTIETSKSV